MQITIIIITTAVIALDDRKESLRYLRNLLLLFYEFSIDRCQKLRTYSPSVSRTKGKISERNLGAIIQTFKKFNLCTCDTTPHPPFFFVLKAQN